MVQSNKLYEDLTTIISRNIDSGAIERDYVRQIIIGLSRDGQSIKLWKSDRWDDYNQYSDEDSIGEISNLDWLNKVDQIGVKTHPLKAASLSYLPQADSSFKESKLTAEYENLVKGIIDEIKEALVKIAQEKILGKFKNLVGLMGYKISNSNYADLVCFYHPEGIETFPGQERRLPGYSSIYGHLAFTDYGFIHFYTKGEDDDELDEVRLFNQFYFSDMDWYIFENGDIIFRVSSTAQEIEISHGHTHEEWGGGFTR